MSKDSETNSQSPFRTFNPFAVPDLFSQWTGDGGQRLQAAVDQWEKWDKKSVERTESAVEEMAHIMRSTIDYSLSLQSEMRQQAIDNSRKMLAMVSGDEQ